MGILSSSPWPLRWDDIDLLQQDMKTLEVISRASTHQLSRAVQEQSDYFHFLLSAYKHRKMAIDCLNLMYVCNVIELDYVQTLKYRALLLCRNIGVIIRFNHL